ncbi:MAG: HAD family hydrolase [Chloroflexi bacterium]|nr:HAD family hydrolase [Chloroflexota bacterium]
MIKAIIFDFDGLILETETPSYITWNDVYRSFGCRLPLDSWVTLIGGEGSTFDPFAELERQVGHPLDLADIETSRRKRELELTEKQPILPGVLQYLDEARQLKLKIGLASSSSRAWVTGHLHRLGIAGYFDCIQTRDDVHRVKPHPDLYQQVMNKLHLSADEAIALEDSPHGIQAAKSAGLFCVAVPNQMTRNLCLEQADLILHSLLDVPLSELISLAENHYQP